MQLTKRRKVVAVILAIGGACGTVVAVLSNIQTLGSFIAPPLRPYLVVVPAICFVFALLVMRHSDTPVDGVLYRENIAHRGRITELETQLQTLTTDNLALRSSIPLIVTSGVKVAVADLGARLTLRNKVMLLVPELRDIWSRIKEPEFTHYELPLHEHAGGMARQAWLIRAQDRYYKPRWEQYLKIWHAEFADRVQELIGELQLAGVASEKLIAFPEADPNYGGQLPVDEFIPMAVPSILVPELLSAADALTRS